jgi:hypothetical protein
LVTPIAAIKHERVTAPVPWLENNVRLLLPGWQSDPHIVVEDSMRISVTFQDPLGVAYAKVLKM